MRTAQVGADKFLNGETRQPFKKTLEMYNSYIDNDFLPLNKEIGYSKQTQLRVKNGKMQMYYPDIVVTNSDIEFFDKINSGDMEAREMYDPNLEGADVVLPNFSNSNSPYIYAKIIKVMRFNEAKGNAGKFE